MKFKRKSKDKSSGISDVWVPNPPSDCQKRVFILEDGNRYSDITICAYKCINQCRAYFNHEDAIEAERKRLAKEKREAKKAKRRVVEDSDVDTPKFTRKK